MRYIVVIIISLILASAAQAAPQDDYTIVRLLPNGNEVTLGTVDWTIEQEQIFRQTAIAAARQNRTNNPAWVIIIYCPTDNPDGYTIDDRCWDSRVDL